MTKAAAARFRGDRGNQVHLTVQESASATSSVTLTPTISPDVQSWLPERTVREKAALQHLLAGQGDRSPIPVWRRGHELLVLDDHERATYCKSHGVPVDYEEHSFESDDEARRFVLERNQARRSLPGLGRRYVDGALYNLEREPGRRTDLTSPHSEGRSGTNALKQRFGCSRATLERDGRLARKIDEAARSHGWEARTLLLDPRHRLTTQHIERFAALPNAEQDSVLEALNAGRVDARLKRAVKLPALQSQGQNAVDVAPPTSFSTAVKTVLSEMEKLEHAAEALAQSEPEAAPVLGESVRKIASGHAALNRKLKHLLAYPLPVVASQCAVTVVNADASDGSLPVQRGYSPHDWRGPVEEMSTEGIVHEIKARLGLADELEAKGLPGIPLGLDTMHFVTLEELRRRADDLEHELARRHSPTNSAAAPECVTGAGSLPRRNAM